MPETYKQYKQVHGTKTKMTTGNNSQYDSMNILQNAETIMASDTTKMKQRK